MTQSADVGQARAPWPARYELLDGLRGLAALAVVLHHVGVEQYGHFAVMVFFVISGYCITASAEACKNRGGGFGSFMAKRIRRIYPPYVLAVAFYAITRFAKAARDPGFEFKPSWLDWLQNFTLTQWVSDLFHPVAWPQQNARLFVAAFWSLNYEEQFYLVIGLLLAAAILLRIPMILSILALSIVCLIWNWLIPGNWICGLFIEYWAHFALGSCLFYILCRFTGRTQRRVFLAVVAALGLSCVIRIVWHQADAFADLRAMVELAFLSVVTLILYFLRPMSHRISSAMLWKPVAALGAISYSLYLIHQFNLTLAASIARRLLPMSAPQALLVACTVVVHVMFGTVFWYFCERPFLQKDGAYWRSAFATVQDARHQRANAN